MLLIVRLLTGTAAVLKYTIISFFVWLFIAAIKGIGIQEDSTKNSDRK